jgi:hypothetical protein
VTPRRNKIASLLLACVIWRVARARVLRRPVRRIPAVNRIQTRPLRCPPLLAGACRWFRRTYLRMRISAARFDCDHDRADLYEIPLRLRRYERAIDAWQRELNQL